MADSVKKRPDLQDILEAIEDLEPDLLCNEVQSDELKFILETLAKTAFENEARINWLYSKGPHA